MLLCFNRGYVKKMTALLLRVISIGTAINFVVPYCCHCSTALTRRAEILLKPTFEWAYKVFGQKVPIRWRRGTCEVLCSVTHGLEPRPPPMLSGVPIARSWWDILSPGSDGDWGSLGIQSLESLFCLCFSLIKWLVLSSFVSFLEGSTPMAAIKVPRGRKLRKTFHLPRIPSKRLIKH